MRFVDCVQGTSEWHTLRLGRVTSSRVAEMMARTKTGWGADRFNYAAELIVERQTGKIGGRPFKSAAMQWGSDYQSKAQDAYEFKTDNEVKQVGFVIHDRHMFGASPDGLVGDDGLVEIKCPLTATHIDTLLTKKFPGKYLLQVQWQLFMTERKWCDLISFDPAMKPNKRLFMLRVWRDDIQIQQLENSALEFLHYEVDRKIAQLESMYPELVAAA